MLLKLRNLLFVVIIIAGIGYGVYYVFVIPSGFTDKEELLNSYFDNFETESSCENHYNPETEDFCINFQNSNGTRTLEVTDLTKNGDDYVVNVLVGGVETEFNFTFIEVEVTGVKSFMNSTYYLIDLFS